MKRTVRRSTALLVLALALGAAAVQAAPAARRPAPEPPGLLAAVRTWLALHLAPGTPPSPRMEKAGCDIDPNGKPRCTPASALDEAGADIDPDGLR